MADMVDGRRHSAAGKVAMPRIGGAQAMGELDAALSKAVGARYVRADKTRLSSHAEQMD